MDKNPFQFYPGKRLPVVCRDGLRRSAVITGYCDTFFSIPAAVQVSFGGKRRTVSGGVYIDRENVQRFAAYNWRENAALIPWTKHKPRLASAALRLIKATAYGHGAPGYIWDWPADHAAALAAGCRHWYGTSQWPEGGCQARAVLKRLPPELLPRLAAYFDRLARFQAMESPPRNLTPPPPPPLA